MNKNAKTKVFEVHVNGHATVTVSARDEAQARARAEAYVRDHRDRLTWDIEIDEAEDVTPEADE
jgi:ATP-dependent Clp protease adapter protein ClpS